MIITAVVGTYVKVLWIILPVALHGYLVSLQEHRLNVFENEVLKMIFVPETEVTGS